MANDDNRRDRDMVLAPNEYMYVSDQTKGDINVFVGPTKQSLSGTDQPVIFNDKSKRFEPADQDQAKQLSKTAPEGWYIVLKNPSKTTKQPTGNSGKLSSAELDVGKKVIVPGPVTFPLWPGQMAKILKGHHLRSNQYLLVRVYDEEEARKNWKKAVIKTVAATDVKQTDTALGIDQPDPIALPDTPHLTMGQVLVIKGTDVSFYIPPTGIEVVPDEAGELVREAVTLERLEYCLLKDEQGAKRYECGPAVVFPEPTEIFLTREEDGGEQDSRSHVRKFRAIELSENSGIYIKVISEYKDGSTTYHVGEELFITGKQQMIYFPREEHAIVKYDKSEIHYAIAIPAGEARYVLDRNKGTVSLVVGPAMFLPDPRSQVIVRRILPFKICSQLYPNNYYAFTHNAKIAGIDIDTYMSQHGNEAVAIAAAAGPAMAMSFMDSMDLYASSSLGSSEASRGMGGYVGTKAAGDSFNRKTKYTEPRSIVLSTKYDGAVTINIYTGYAVLLVKWDGSRRVVQGPQAVLLNYDEIPEIQELSTGKPKTTDNMLRTAYLRTKANKISDIVSVETSDFCQFDIKLSYRMDFTGEPESWFGVENYVKFLCDNLRSRLKNAIRQHGVEEFYHDSTDIIRAAVLKETPAGLGPRLFPENGMQVYDVEVLKVQLVNNDIQELISKSQKAIIQTTIALANQRRTLEAGIQEEDIKQRMAEVKAKTQARLLELESDTANKRKESSAITIVAEAETTALRLSKELDAQKARNDIAAEARLESKADADFRASEEIRKQDLRITMIQAEIAAVVQKSGAITPQLVAALQAFGDNELVIKAAEAMAPLSILGGKSIGEVLSGLLAGTRLESVAKIATNGGNGLSAKA